LTERDVKVSDAFKIWQRMRQTINNLRNVRRAKEIWRVRVTIATKYVSNHGSKGKYSNKGTLILVTDQLNAQIIIKQDFVH